MKTKLFFTAMLAVLLVSGLVFVACGDGSGDIKSPNIPTRFTGQWEADIGYGPFICLVINSNGTGSVFHSSAYALIDCTFEFSTVDGIEKLKMIIPEIGECTYDVSIEGGMLVLANAVPGSEDASAIALAAYEGMSPYTRNVPDTGGDEDEEVVIPEELEGSWKATSLGGAGKVVFIINSTGPKVFASTDNGATGGLVDCIWNSTEAGKLTLTYTVLVCTFDYSFDGEDRLVLSNPVSNEYGEALEGYVAWGPFEKDE